MVDIDLANEYEKDKNYFFFMEKKVSNLMRWVVNGHGFVKAYHSVMRNKGAPGVDGVKTEDLPKYLLNHWESIKEELLLGTYRPQSVRGMNEE